MTIQFNPNSCKIVVPPEFIKAAPGLVWVTAVIAKDADTMAGQYAKGDVVMHCHDLMPEADARRIVEQTNQKGADMAQFWAHTGMTEENATD